MRNTPQKILSAGAVLALVAGAAGLVSGCASQPAAHPEADRLVSGEFQMRPGGPVERAEMGVWEAPVEPPSKAAGEVDLADEELVIGVVAEGRAMAYPIRFVAMHEIIDDRIGETPIAATW